MGLQVQLVLLIDVASKLGQIIQNRQTTLNNIAATNNKLTIILVVVVVAALVFAVLISLIITRSLEQLAFGMDSLSVLDFAEDLKSSLLASGSRFSEVSKCERSFHSLERYQYICVNAQSFFLPQVRLLHSPTLDGCNLFRRI